MEDPWCQSCTFNGTSREGRGKQEAKVGRAAVGPETEESSPKKGSSSLPQEPGSLGWVTLGSQLNTSFNQKRRMLLGGFKSEPCIFLAVCPGQGTCPSEDGSSFCNRCTHTVRLTGLPLTLKDSDVQSLVQCPPSERLLLLLWVPGLWGLEALICFLI